METPADLERHDSVTPFLVPCSGTILQAMERLEQTEEKIVFAVDAETRLVGSLTDGDIRRWILSGGDLKADVRLVCNSRPFVVEEGFDESRLRNEMLAGNFSCVPVVNGSREIVRLVFWKEIFKGELGTVPRRRLDLPVVIMAGGLGTRLAPFTNVLPKPLIPIGDKTIIEIIIDQFLAFGANEFVLSINYKSKILKSFFEELAPAYKVRFLEEKERRGTAGGLRELHQSEGDLVVSNCDIVVQADVGELVAFHQENGYDVTLVASLKQYRIPYGVCELEKSGGLSRIKEKPDYSFLVNTGMYVVRRECLAMLPEDGVCDMTDFIQMVKDAGGRVGVFPIGENAWIDTGEWTEYRKAVDSLGKLGSR